jgi:phosphatidylserine/phosphatidylglycerophosphate/cardiolipin synthase-like enzyme
LAYKVPDNVPAPDSDALIRLVTALSDAQMRRGCAVEVFPEATTFYPAELEAIAASEHSVHLEAYIFRDGVNAQTLLKLLTERAKAGVSVKLVLDSFGNLFVPKRIFAELVRGRARRLVPAGRLVVDQAVQQPHPPRAAHHRREGRLLRRRRHRRLVDRRSRQGTLA